MSDVGDVYHLTAVVFGLGQLVASAEVLFLHASGRVEQYLPWRIVRLRVRSDSFGEATSRTLVLDALYRPKIIITVAAARVVASGGMMLVSPFTSSFTASIAVLTVAMLYQSYRSSMGTEGSDQMFAIIAIALLLGGNAFASPLAAKVCLAFIVLQAVLSYTTSGIAKLISPIWRSGSALPAVLSTHSHGLPAFGRLLSKHRNVALLASWFVIVFEASFSLAIVSPNLALLYISAGVMLHVSIAYTMGLNLFLFAFTATYPAVFWAAESLRLVETLLS